ncbi:MAG: DNA-directed RNA polymerase subunit L [Candidatus Micrarchaeota archaeon]|nr:DNA-directed RNA polymerase subunit L [Candidatus Micrarchaeota archaeon]
MKINVIASGEDSLEIELEGEGRGFANFVKDKLMGDEKVLFASCIMTHPTIGWPRITVRTKGEKPAKALLRAVAKAAKEIKAFGDGFKKASKKKTK